MALEEILAHACARHFFSLWIPATTLKYSAEATNLLKKQLAAERRSRFRSASEQLGATIQSKRKSGAGEIYRQIVEASSSAIIMVAADGEILFVNARAESLFDYTRTELIGQPIRMLFPPGLCPELPDPEALPLPLAASERGDIKTQLQGLHKDGTRLDIEFSCYPIQTENGLCTLTTITEISKRNNLQELYKKIVEAAPTAGIMINQSGEIVLVNAQTERLFGYPRKEMLGQKVEMLIPKRMRRNHPSMRDQYFEKRQARDMGVGRDLYGERNDGHEFPIEIGLSPIETDEGPLVLAAVIDITERRRQEERFRKVVEAAPYAILMLDQDSRIVLANTQAETLFGYMQEELIGMDSDELVPQRIRQKRQGKRTGYFRIPHGRPMALGRQLTVRRSDDTELPVEIGLNPVEGTDGQFMLATVSDVTERKRAAEVQAELNASLAMQVEETNIAMDDLKQAQNQLVQSEKMASLGALVAGIAHEINTPVGIGVTAASHLWDEAKRVNELSVSSKLTKKDFNSFLALSQQSGQMLLSNLSRAAELIHSFKQIAVDQSTDDKRKINLKSYIEEIMLSLKPRLKQVAQKVEIECDETIELETVPGAWSQVISNLVLNAINHAWPDNAEGMIQLIGSKNKDGIQLIVRDDGAGISKEALPRVFDPFYTTKRGQGGTGLGLNIVFNLVTRTLGGEITVSSEVGVGTAFTIDIASSKLQGNRQ